MENKKVEVISTVNSVVFINDPQVRFSRSWDRKGTKRVIEFDTLQELSYDPGVWNLLKEGTLYIEDMEVKKALGLESEDADEPTEIIVLDDNQKKRYLTVATMNDLKEICSKINKNQIEELVKYAIDNEIVNYDKLTYLRGLCGIDAIKAIELNRKDKND